MNMKFILLLFFLVSFSTGLASSSWAQTSRIEDIATDQEDPGYAEQVRSIIGDAKSWDELTPQQLDQLKGLGITRPVAVDAPAAAPELAYLGEWQVGKIVAKANETPNANAFNWHSLKENEAYFRFVDESTVVFQPNAQWGQQKGEWKLEGAGNGLSINFKRPCEVCLSAVQFAIVEKTENSMKLKATVGSETAEILLTHK